MTTREGAAAKAGHDLTIEVRSWSGEVTVEDSTAQLQFTADSRSLNVLDGTGGIKSLTASDKDNIKKTIDKDVLKGCAISFSSTSGAINGDRLTVQGELELGGKRSPIQFDLFVNGDRLTGRATVKQTNFGMKPYTAMFGTLRVADEIGVVIDAAIS